MKIPSIALPAHPDSVVPPLSICCALAAGFALLLVCVSLACGYYGEAGVRFVFFLACLAISILLERATA